MWVYGGASSLLKGLSCHLVMPRGFRAELYLFIYSFMPPKKRAEIDALDRCGTVHRRVSEAVCWDGRRTRHVELTAASRTP